MILSALVIVITLPFTSFAIWGRNSEPMARKLASKGSLYEIAEGIHPSSAFNAAEVSFVEAIDDG